LFGSWVLEGKGGEGEAWEEVNPYLGVFKKIRKDFGGLFYQILKFPKLGGFGGLTI
jgi:hypothetical protein